MQGRNLPPKEAVSARRTGLAREYTGEEDLLAGILARDEAAFERLYRSYHPRLTRFLMNVTRRPALVDEVLNDTMLVVWSNPQGFDGSSRLSSWIFGIAYRKALSAMRKQDLPIEDGALLERASDRPDPEQDIAAARMHGSIHDAIARLSPDHRTVVELTYFHSFGYREIAEIMGCPVDTVKTRMFHARRRLAQMFAGTLADWV